MDTTPVLQRQQQSQEPDPTRDRRADPIPNEVFDRKLNFCAEIFGQWLQPFLDLSKCAILDFGCGEGTMALGIALRSKANRVIGVDIVRDFDMLPRIAQEQIGLSKLPENLEFHLITPSTPLASRFRVECVFTWSVFEHIDQGYLDDVVSDLREVISPNGYVFLQIGPLYYSGHGSHLYDFVKEPWAHLLLQHDKLRESVLNAKHTILTGQIVNTVDEAQFQEHKKRAWQCYETLNKVTGDDIVELFERHGFTTIREHRTNCAGEPSDRLKRVFSEKVLKNEQIAILFQKAGH